MDDYSRQNSKFSTVLVIILIIALAGVAYYFFIYTNNEKSNKTEEKEKEVVSNITKIEFVKRINGTSGNLYLGKDNKAYFVLSNILSVDSIATLAQEFNIEKNDIYNSDTVKAILIVLPSVTDIGYDDEKSNFTLKTKDDIDYSISDADIRTNNRIYLEEVKPLENDDKTSIDETNKSGENNNGSENNTGTPNTPNTSTESEDKKTETTTDSSKTGECRCKNGSKGQRINGVCTSITVSCSGNNASHSCTPTFKKCE